MLEWQPNINFSAKTVRIFGANDKIFDGICDTLSADTVTFYKTRVTNLSSLTKISGLKRLWIEWNNKLIDLSPLASLTQLDALVLIDIPKANDLSPLAKLKNLRLLEFSGAASLSKQNTAATLSPLGALKQLEELHLRNVKIIDDGLRPLAKCSNLKRLYVANTFATEDYAYLAANLPKVTCQHFAATVPLTSGVFGDGLDTMVVGKRKPLLSSKHNADRIAKYEKRFAELKAQFLKA